jgi:hypothetical protein
MPGVDPDAKDWRLQVALQGDASHGPTRGLFERVRGHSLTHGVESVVPADVVVTHDGETLFAYAADADTLASARRAIEQALSESEDAPAHVSVSHWDDALDRWRQVDPPPSDAQRARQEAADRDALALQRQTFVANVGREIRGEFEQSLERWANELGVECEVVEHAHLLSTQVAFNVRGPRRKVEEFVTGLQAEERATMRAELGVMTSPL